VLSGSSVEVGSAEVSSAVVAVLRAVVEGVGVSEAEGVGDVELSPCELVLSSSEVAVVETAVDD
jgi:hypothetical protein